ncbi:neuraminidase-like domain-containing protein [Brevibacillus sp. B_LB10_24]|uniref:Tc toxin subunit A-related protein n=1 Tax=Brevibacillus sp. B_LB10_24 TaxID=3380645 RepID=UPI0038BBB490
MIYQFGHIKIPPKISVREQDSKSIGDIQSALQALEIDISPGELARKEMGESTAAGIKAFQERSGLPADGKLTQATVDKLNSELIHDFVVRSKTRTQRLQQLLQLVGLQIDSEEIKNRAFDPSTKEGLIQFQKLAGLLPDGRISEDTITKLRTEAIKVRFSSKSQVGQLQRTLLRALNIAKIKDVTVDQGELKEKKIGPTMQSAMKAVQKKYGLPVTGELTPETYDLLVSLAASIPKPINKMKSVQATELKPIKKVVRLNMWGPHVNDLQTALSHLGYPIDETEYKNQQFGKSTREAVLQFQRSRSLPVTGKVEGETMAALNSDIRQVNPQAFNNMYPCRIRGSVRDELWVGMPGIKVQIWVKPIVGEPVFLAERQTSRNGFYDIPYEAPCDPYTGKVQSGFSLLVKAIEADKREIGSRQITNPPLISWANFTLGNFPYRGKSVFEERTAAVQKVIGGGVIAKLVEMGENRQISQTAMMAGLSPEDVMRLVLAYLVSAEIGHDILGPEVCYAFIGQNLPPGLPGDLLRSTEEWELIEHLVELTESGLVFMDIGLQASAFKNAIELNLIPIAVIRQQEAILAALSSLQRSYALEKPILIGNGSLKALMDASPMIQSHADAVVDAFLQYKNMDTDFWNHLKQNPGKFGGTAAVKEFETAASLGHLTKNFIPMLTLLKKKIADSNVRNITSARALARLTTDQFIDLIKENGGQVPPNTDGDTPEERIRTYAATLASQCEQMFPADVLAAYVARSANSPLSRVSDIQQMLVDHPDLDLRKTNLDAFFAERQISDPELLTEARVMQRVHRIAPAAATGKVLLDRKIHNSSQIISLGKDRFLDLMTSTGQVNRRTALTVYSMAEFQYAQVLQRITEYRFEMHRADPKAIIDYTYHPDELPTPLDIPTLETLFGSLDYCNCSHCQSVYSPAAYLADVLQYLDSHDSAIAGKTVKDILFDRRPDIGNIKLNCENTETSLPYIDLVCEVLENAISAPSPTPDFNFQTTRTAEELRAFPEHVRTEAYDTLKTADYPLDVSFHLQQEEVRVFLRHLGVQRWELMEKFQGLAHVVPTTPSDVSIAGEYWGMSTHETTIITTPASTVAKQTIYWGFDASVAQITVAAFMRRSRLTYGQLLELLSVRWINPPEGPNPMAVERPNATCNTEEQKLVGLTVDRLDKMHRFLRLWRHSGWMMWELDLLIRNASLGSNRLDNDALVHLKQFRQLQQRLGLGIEQALMLYGDINTEERFQPDTPERKIEPLYSAMFLNSAVIRPTDPAFVLPLAGTDHLSEHKAVLQAAFSVNEEELNRLLEQLPNDKLILPNLSMIGRRVYLARSLNMEIKDFLTMEVMTSTVGAFASPEATLAVIEQIEWTNRAGMTADELDYLLHDRNDSLFSLRSEAIVQFVEALREALRSSNAEDPRGTITAQIASAFALPAEQVQMLLVTVQLGGSTLDAILSDKTLTERDDAGAYTKDVTATNFPAIFKVYRFMHKAAMLLTRLKVTAVDLRWLLTKASGLQLLDPSALPVDGDPLRPLFPAWLSLCQWLYFKEQYPEPEDVSLRSIFDKALNAQTPEVEMRSDIARLMQWSSKELDELAAGLGLQHGGSTSDYGLVSTYLRLHECFIRIKRIGVGAGSLLAWSNRDNDTDGAQAVTSQQIRHAVKSKYDFNVWLEKITSMEDEIREKKRDALISYLVETSLRSADPVIVENGKSYPNPAYWADANDLLNYFLIDVEMSACQLTSRIKQAISSTQMFVQRCLLGLERPFVEVSRAESQETSSDNSWNQWRWMKNYRIWEANRKVFLYPENWIEPELRDDKTPFFEELESEIMQKEITDENVQAALLNYVQKVHEVARLDITGAYYELDDTNPQQNLPPDINVLHVIGRTRAQPAIYYYRRFDLNDGAWSAWERIDLDIQSNQVIPVVYNRQLYLFWLTFIEKPQKVKKQPPARPTNDTTVPETPNQLEIQLAWSLRKNGGGWSAKRVSKQKLIHPWQRPHFAYNLKPRYKIRENQLWLDLYVSQTLEFNNTRFWDAYRNQPDFVTGTRFQENARPWHSSSFVFDGEIVDVKMKGLIGNYRVLGKDGIASDSTTLSTSYDFVHDNYGDDGRNIHRFSGHYEIAPRLPLPEGMHYHNTRLVNNKYTLNANRANVLENGHTRTLLNGAKSPFEIVFSQHQLAFDTTAWGQVPFFYQDNFRAFFIKPRVQQVSIGYNQTLQTCNYDFYPFYHPYTALFMRELKRSGVEGLLNRRIQIKPQDFYPSNSFDFLSYSPAAMSKPDQTAKRDILDFERYGAYAIYNWEIFFHAPLMIACKLSANQRFEEAMRWFHFIFDPTNTESSEVPQRYWITRPFYEQNSEDYRNQRIEVLLQNIEQHTDELRTWKNNPFKPHLIARFRPVAYQKAVVMKYIDNLIAWGDQLFRQDSIETINEATTLYVLAYELLGRRPVKVPNVEHEDRSYNELAADGALDRFGNKRVDILMENFTGSPIRITRTSEGAEPLPKLDTFYFRIPDNDSLLEYWNTVEDRLFKIRHCMNIDGVVRQLPLFEPPIDPALLVKAAASGVDLGSVLSDVTTGPSPYRFQRVVQKARELCGEVKALGDKLLSVLEKYDAEGLSLLRSTQGIQLQQAVREVRKQQIQEANEILASLERSKTMAQQKKDYYGGRDLMNAWEFVSLGLGGTSALITGTLGIGYSLKAALELVPKVTAGASGFGGSPHVTADPVDGAKLGASAGAALQAVNTVASTLDKLGALAATMGNYTRRKEEWDFQSELASTEIKQLDKQIAAAKVRLAIAQKELDNQDLQIDQSRAADEYMRSKYTNQQLYDWQIKQLSAIYFQSYQMAYEMSKRAQQCYQFEIGDWTESFVQFGYWDSLKRGLLAGERLANDISRMESAYLEQNKRDFEITKHVSLVQLAPLKLVELKQSGACTVTLPEWLFDMDYPGHYRRRIKSVSLSIPCVVGPYTSLNCTVSLTNHGIRMKDEVGGNYGDPLVGGDARFYKSPAPVTMIATSHGQNDAGIFELNFQDERFLPFEGAGAVSEWRLELPQENNQFDLSTISDVILHIRYTARASSNQGLIHAAQTNLRTVLPSAGIRLLVLNHEFGTAWQRFLHPDGNSEQILAFTLERMHLPFYARGKTNINLTHVDLLVEGKETGSFDVKLKVPGVSASDETMDPDPSYGERQHLVKSGFASGTPFLGEWRLQIKKVADGDFRSLQPGDIRNAYLVLGFKTS